jgi:hypothetical protein
MLVKDRVIGNLIRYEAGKLFLGIDRTTVKLLVADGAKHIGELQAWT